MIHLGEAKSLDITSGLLLYTVNIMADKLLREDKDYRYFVTDEGDEYRRYNVGNSLGKAPHSLADKHPKAEKALKAKIRGNGNSQPLAPHEWGAAMQAFKGESQAKREAKVKAAVTEALMSHPDTVTDYDGLVIMSKAQFELASDSEAGSHSTKAADWLLTRGGYVKEKRSIGTAIQVNVTMDENAALRLAELGYPLGQDVIEAESREAEEAAPPTTSGE